MSCTSTDLPALCFPYNATYPASTINDAGACNGGGASYEVVSGGFGVCVGEVGEGGLLMMMECVEEGWGYYVCGVALCCQCISQCTQQHAYNMVTTCIHMSIHQYIPHPTAPPQHCTSHRCSSSRHVAMQFNPSNPRKWSRGAPNQQRPSSYEHLAGPEDGGGPST